MPVEVEIVNEFDHKKRNVEIRQLRMPSQEASFAVLLMGHIGVALAKPDGEDSAGRQKFTYLLPEEVASRACEIAKAAFSEFEKRDWLCDLPSLKDEDESE